MNFEVVDKKGITIQTRFLTVTHEKFLNEVIKRFSKVMIGVKCSKEPFSHIYFQMPKTKLIEVIKMNRCKVTYSIMYNSRVNSNLKDVLYIKQLKQTII